VQIEILSAPDPPTAFQDRIAELLKSGELRRGDAQILLNAVRHEGQSALVAIRQVEKWERQGRLSSELADALIDRLNALLEESSPGQTLHRGHHGILDAVFSQIGRGSAGRHLGRFRG
jgi:hypothetical protein